MTNISINTSNNSHTNVILFNKMSCYKFTSITSLIITTVEVENDNSITSVELTKLYPANADIPFAVTNITTNGNADDIKQVYAVVDDCRGLINDKLKSIAYSLNNCFDINKLDEITDDNATNEINYDGIL